MADTLLHNSVSGPSFITTDLRGSRLMRRRWLYHLLFWLTYYSLLIILYLSFKDSLTILTCLLYLLTLAFQALFVYFNIYVLIPRLLFEKKYAAYGVALCCSLVLCAVVVMLVEDGYIRLLEPGILKNMTIISWSMLGIQYVQAVYLAGMATAAKFLKDFFFNQQLIKEKEKQYLETELKFLRSQIHPHFFFNTLNNIYSLSLKKSEEAPGVILKLSDLMSYMLYESNVPLVPLEKEIRYLRNYLDVEQLRFGERLTVSFTITTPIREVDIPPMILILFLENSFKHGVKNNISRIHIDISLTVEGDFLYFRVENPVTEYDARKRMPFIPADIAPSENKGIGLKNVRRRLDLLYGNNYTLDIGARDGKFIVSLKMPLC